MCKDFVRVTVEQNVVPNERRIWKKVKLIGLESQEFD